ncbi:MAG: septal ring lytic transglycosylase RlpA family protein [Candidatus Sumerlaeaceae bacterium]
MAKNRKVATRCSIAALCFFGAASMAFAAPTYYTDGTMWNDGSGSLNSDQSTNFTASYNMAAQGKGTRRTAKSSSRVQPNTYFESNGTSSAPSQYSSTWAPTANTYSYDTNDQAAQDPYSQWNSSYQTQSQTPKRRGVLSKIFRRDSPAADTGRSYSPAAVLRGVASWYGRDFHGGKTANGERYDMNSMTAAHRSLPFGTLVKVTNECNGRECVVRINNRGPYLKGRILDLSKAAASQLGMVSRGVSRVQMQVLGQ